MLEPSGADLFLTAAAFQRRTKKIQLRLTSAGESSGLSLVKFTLLDTPGAMTFSQTDRLPQFILPFLDL